MQIPAAISARGQSRTVRFGAYGLATLTLFGGGFLLADAATADPANGYNIELSVDGVHWANPLTEPLLPAGMVWVPGDLETISVWVRTTCDAAFGVATWALAPDAGHVWADNLQVRTRTEGQDWGEEFYFKDCQATHDFTLTADEPIKLDLEIKFPYGDATAVSANPTQARMVEITNAAVTLACDGAITSRPAMAECKPVDGIRDDNHDHDPHKKDEGSGGDTSDGGNGSGTASGIMAQGRLHRMAQTGVEALRTLTAAALLTVVGAWLALKVKGVRHHA